MREEEKFACSCYVINLFRHLKILDCLELVYPFISVISFKEEGKLIKSIKLNLHIK
jgi:hypothetical protein